MTPLPDTAPSWRIGSLDVGRAWLRRLSSSFGPAAIRALSVRIDFARQGVAVPDSFVARWADCSTSHARNTRRKARSLGLLTQDRQVRRLTPRGYRSNPLRVRVGPMLAHFLRQRTAALYLRFKRARKSQYPSTSPRGPRTPWERGDALTLWAMFGSWEGVCSLAPPARA